MTQEEKLKEAKRLYETANSDQIYVLESLFPELKESEDERIRKWLIGYFQRNKIAENIKTHDILAWLEKQGEQKSVVIIPKFRIGDNIKTTNEEPLTITKIDDKGYWSEDLFICNFDDADKWELVEHKPAWSEEDSPYYDDICEILINLLHSETTNVNKDIIQKDLNWLVSIKNRVIPQPKQEWSEEDENNLDSAIYHIRREPYRAKDVEPIVDWLRSLKERYTWRPNNRQMNALDSTLQYSQVSHNSFEYLNSLFNDLKKLRGEQL